MTAYIVTAPLVIARSIEDTDVYLYQGMPVPQLRAGEIARLKDGEYVEALPDLPSAEEIAERQKADADAAAQAEQARFDAAVQAAVDKRLAEQQEQQKTPPKAATK